MPGIINGNSFSLILLLSITKKTILQTNTWLKLHQEGFNVVNVCVDHFVP